MPRYTKVAIICNPVSTGSSQTKGQALARKLKRAFKDTPIEVLETQYSGHAEGLAYTFAKGSKKPLIISSSGDGGYNEVINGAMRAQREGSLPTCAVIPSGNANDHFRSMHKNRASTVIIRGRIHKIDLLKVTIKAPGKKPVTRYAHSYIGMGLTSIVAGELNKHTLNRFKEAWLSLKLFLSFRPTRIEHNGKIIAIDSLICTNIGQMAKVLTVAKDAQPDDGKFELILSPHRSKPRLLQDVLRATFGSLQSRQFSGVFRFTSRSNTSIQLDGEVMSLSYGSQVSIYLEPHCLRTPALH